MAKIVDFRVRRTTEGINIRVTSPKMEEFFKGLSREVQKTPVMAHQVGELDVFMMDRGVAPAISGASFNDASKPFIDGQGTVNLMVLQAKGVGNGVDVNFKEVHSRTALEKAGETIKLAMQQLYQEYMEPIEVSVTVEDAEANENE